MEKGDGRLHPLSGFAAFRHCAILGSACARAPNSGVSERTFEREPKSCVRSCTAERPAALAMAHYRYQHVDTRIVRIFNTYGPRLQIDDGRVISNFMSQSLRGQNLTVYGDGLQTRSFCFVSDEVDGILALSKSNEHFPINIGNPAEFTMLECARLVIEVTGSKSVVQFEPLPQDDPKRRCPDIDKAKRILGWEPKINLRTGLQSSLSYFMAAVQTTQHAAR
jgi:dTDP-glucose 4,6-dehydratase